jgi:hypothetical protein
LFIIQPSDNKLDVIEMSSNHFQMPLMLGGFLGTKVMKSQLAVTELVSYFPFHLHGMFNKYRHV